jgi:DNA polymerase-3 subunit gamma/tau
VQEHFRKVFLLQFSELQPEDLEVDEGTYEGLRDQAKSFTPTRVVHFIQTLREAAKEMQSASSPRLLLEEALVSMARNELDASPQALSARIESLEAEVERLLRQAGTPAQGAAADERRARAQKAEEEKVTNDTGQVEAEDETENIVDLEVEEEVAPSQVPPIPTGTVDLVALRRAWPRIKERVKEKKITTHAFLLEGKPAAVSDGEVVISFAEGHSFHRGELEKDDHKRVLQEALEEVLGVELNVRSVLEEEPALDTGKGDGEREEAGHGPRPDEGERGHDDKPRVERGKSASTQVPEKGSPSHDAGKVKLVKDIFGAEMIEEIKLNE